MLDNTQQKLNIRNQKYQMKFLITLTLITFLANISLYGQFRYHILFEGKYPIDGDSTLYRNLDWYGFYVRDSLHEYDLIEKVEIKLQYLKNYEGFFTEAKSTLISTSSSRKSLFLLGVERGQQLDFKPKHRCGATYAYSLPQTTLLPGRCVDWGTPTMSCSHLSVFALGSVKEKEWWKIRKYQIFAERSVFFETKKKVQNLTADIYGSKKRSMIYSVPFVYATGDFDFDAETDFILWYDGTFYLYLSRFAHPQEVAALVAKSKLKKMINGGNTGEHNKFN